MGGNPTTIQRINDEDNESHRYEPERIAKQHLLKVFEKLGHIIENILDKKART